MLEGRLAEKIGDDVVRIQRSWIRIVEENRGKNTM